MSQKTSSKIPYIFIVFFAVILLVNIAYIYISNKTWRGIATENSYKKGLEYNQIIAANKKQKLLGWKIKIKFENLGNNSGLIQINLFDKYGSEIKDADVVLNLKRPVQEGFDFKQDLKYSNGSYRALIKFSQKGQWEFEVIADKKGNITQEVKRYIVQ